MAFLSVASIASLDGTPDCKADQDHKREVDQRRKYAYGSEQAGSRVRPVTQNPTRVVRMADHGKTAFMKKTRSTKRPLRTDEATNSSDSSDWDRDLERCLEDSPRPAPQLEPIAGVAYSYDASTGPSHGSDILSVAVNKAVQRFESKATEKLVKSEYEVVRAEKEVEARNVGYAADEDEYELL